MKVKDFVSLKDIEQLLAANADNFDELALSVFRYQYAGNDIYRQYCNALRVDPQQVHDITGIPFLPISFFKSHRVLTGAAEATLVFESSGTMGEIPSRHFVTDEHIYRQSLLQGFSRFYGDPAGYTFLALLPSYLERKNASLVHMAKVLMAHSGQADNGFYINEWEKLAATLQRLIADGQKVLLLGVTFALLDFAAAYPMPLGSAIVMETGGMKGRRTEMTRAEVHDELKRQWHLAGIHSEYGMTELLSQAYATGDGLFGCTNTMKVLVRDMNDPLDVKLAGSGAANVIDLANVHSCSFIATEDLVHVNKGLFEVLGRVDHTALRGCSLMTA